MRSFTTVGADQITTMMSITSARWTVSGPNVDHHVGDIAWGLRDRSLPTRVVFLEDRAFALFHEDPYKFAVRPGDEDLYGQLIDAVGEDATFWALDTELDKIEALASRGYRPENDGHTWHLAQELDDLPAIELPSGWSIRDATSPKDWKARVDVHRAAWEPSQFSEKLYEVVRTTSPYRADLDVGVVSPEGQWAAYCIAWLDTNASAGELEPVGTAPEYRRRGLGQAACLAALHGLREAGATRCVVGAVMDPDNQGPRYLYESIGFRVVGRVCSFRRA